MPGGTAPPPPARDPAGPNPGRPLRVAVVAEVYLPKVDGVVMRTVRLLRELKRRGDEVLVLTPPARPPRDPAAAVGTDDNPARVAECRRAFPFPAYPEYRIGLPDGGVATAVRDFAPDVVHFVNPFAFGFRVHDLLLGSGVDAPTLFSFHTLYGEFVRRYGPPLSGLAPVLWWLTKSYHNRADANLTVSAATRDDLSNRGFQRVGLWRPAVDASLYRPAARDDALRAEHGAGPGRPLLLTVSRLAPEKNVGLLAGVLDRLPAAGVGGAKLLIVGDGPARPALEKRFAGRDVAFLGYRTGAALARAYASADAFVYASETETMGNVVLEAMAAGCPVVAPRAGGIPSVVDAGRTGLLYEPGDAAACAAAVGRVLNDADTRASLIENGLSHTAGLTWAAAAGGVRDDYLRVIAARETAPGRGPAPRRARLAAAALVAAFRAADLAARTDAKADRRAAREV